MSDWEAFIESVPWFLDSRTIVKVSAPRKRPAFSPAATALFPSLGKLLAKASVTDVSLEDARYELLAWDTADGERFGWLCLPPIEIRPSFLHDDHRQLMECFGGIVERSNEPEDTWLLNLNDALTEREASHDGSFLDDYMWAFDDAGLSLPIKPAEYYSIAREANGNTTLCHRINGSILMFAPDHSFDHLIELEGCPAYTLYTIKGAATFREWVDSVAVQWLAHIEGPI